MRTFLTYAGWVVGLLLALVLLLRFWPGTRPVIADSFEIISHRGVHQTFPLDQTNDPAFRATGCTAKIIYPPTHEFVENTIPSIKAAFDAGATVVEIDIHHTKDDHIVVFHDWTLDCRTDGKGVTQEQTLAYLKGLDIGYGYTADGGKTFPFRGKFVGMMPTLEEVLRAFPEKRFLLDHKSGSEHTLKVLAKIVAQLPVEQQRRLSLWGEDKEGHVPNLSATMFTRGGMKRCGIAYAKSLGITALPEACRGRDMILPVWAVKYLWGWPDRFMQTVVEADGRFFLAEVDTVEEANAVAELPIHGVMTNTIELVGPALTRARD